MDGIYVWHFKGDNFLYKYSLIFEPSRLIDINMARLKVGTLRLDSALI